MRFWLVFPHFHISNARSEYHLSVDSVQLVSLKYVLLLDQRMNPFIRKIIGRIINNENNSLPQTLNMMFKSSVTGAFLFSPPKAHLSSAVFTVAFIVHGSMEACTFYFSMLSSTKLKAIHVQSTSIQPPFFPFHQ